MSTSTLVRARVWTEDDSAQAPEQRTGVLREPLPQTAVCFSGGGTRSMVATIGQLRGLATVGALDRFGYVSCVSGSAWAVVPFLFAADGSTRLGTVTPPHQLSLERLEQISPDSLLASVTESFLDPLVRLDADATVPSDQTWCRAVGEVFLGPHGLYDATHPVPFGPARGSLAGELAQPGTDRSCHRPARAHPFPVVHTTLNWPEPRNAGQHRLAFEHTPLYAGAPGRREVRAPDGVVRTVGGTYIEPIGINGAPAAGANEAHGWIDVVPGPRPFTLADMVGATSALYTPDRAASGYPHACYRTIPAAETGPHTVNDLFTDGGDVDTHALLGMLRRRIPRVVIFLNTIWPLDPDYDHGVWPAEGQLDPALAPLFGQPSEQWSNNHVFPRAAFRDVVDAWQQAQRHGRPLVASTTLPVLANPWWGIAGGWEVSVCWVYNDRAADWESDLPPATRALLAAPESESLVARFPHYRTIGQNPGALTRLTPVQANLLADLSGWGVLESADALRDVLG